MKIAYHLMRVNTCRRARYGTIVAGSVAPERTSSWLFSSASPTAITTASATIVRRVVRVIEPCDSRRSAMPAKSVG